MTTVDGDEMILGKTTKLKHFGRVIEMFRRKFPSHDMWTTDYDNWYSKTKAWFSAACDRRRVEDAGDSELMRKSEPLYRNLENSRSLIRPKYLSGPNKTVIDFNKITLSMIDDGTLLSGRGRTLVFASCGHF